MKDSNFIVESSFYAQYYYYINEEGIKLLHRVDGPAVEYTIDTCYAYYLLGDLHRAGGPAIKYADGTESYYLWGKKFTKEEYLSELDKLQRF